MTLHDLNDGEHKYFVAFVHHDLGGNARHANFEVGLESPIRSYNDIHELEVKLSASFGIDRVMVINWRKFDE